MSHPNLPRNAVFVYLKDENNEEIMVNSNYVVMITGAKEAYTGKVKDCSCIHTVSDSVKVRGTVREVTNLVKGFKT